MHSRGINQENIQLMNRELVLRVLRKNEGCSRAELAKITNLKPATITNIINEFQASGLVLEKGVISEGKGRSAIRLFLNPNAYNVVGVRVAREYLIVGVFDVRGDELQTVRLPIENNTHLHELLADMKYYIHKAIEEWAKGKVIAIGCAVPGPFLKKEGKVALMTGDAIWRNIDIKRELEKEFSLPIIMEHDANAGALAYYWTYGEDLQQTLVYIAAGQGVGSGIVYDGSLVYGQQGTAGEIGHMSISFDGRYCECGNRGCLEMYCSTIALKKEIHRALEQGSYSCLNRDCTFAEIKEAVQQEDRLAVDCYKKVCYCLAIGIVNVVNMLNPNTIVIDDDVVSVNPKMVEETIENVVKGALLPELWNQLQIIIGEGTQAFVLKGVAILASEKLFKESYAG